MLAVQTGSQLYVGRAGGGDDGRPLLRDAAFDAHLAGSVSTRWDEGTVAELVDIGRRGLAQFYADLANDPTLVDRDGPLGYLIDVARRIGAGTTTMNGGNNVIIDNPCIPITDDVHAVPRIEVRENNSAVVFVGVPSSLGSNYFDVPQHLRRDGRRQADRPLVLRLCAGGHGQIPRRAVPPPPHPRRPARSGRGARRPAGGERRQVDPVARRWRCVQRRPTI